MDLLIGIDWADDHHDICLMDPEGKILKEFQILQGIDGFHQFGIELKKYEKDQVLICIETNHGLLFEHLACMPHKLFVVNPGALVDYRKRYHVSGAKDDKIDARLLANFLRTEKHRLRPYQMNGDLVETLKLLTEDRARLLKNKIRMQLQLIDTLKQYYPIALELFSDIATAIGLAFLEEYPTPEKAQKVSLNELKRFLKKQRYSWPKRLEEIFSLLQKEQPRARALFVEAKTQFVMVMIPQIRLITGQIAFYDKRISECFKQHPDHDMFSSLPGVAEGLGPRLLSSLGDFRDRFSGFNEIQCLAGTAPVTKRSGKQCFVHFRVACNKSFRNTMQQMAFSSLKESIWAKHYYQEQRQKGKTHNMAVRALANKWLRAIYALWIHGTSYDENVHLAHMKRISLIANIAAA